MISLAHSLHSQRSSLSQYNVYKRCMSHSNHYFYHGPQYRHTFFQHKACQWQKYNQCDIMWEHLKRTASPPMLTKVGLLSMQVIFCIQNSFSKPMICRGMAPDNYSLFTFMVITSVCIIVEVQCLGEERLSKSKHFDGIVPSIFDFMNHLYLSSWGHSRLVITDENI